MTHNQPRAFSVPKQKDLSRTEQCCVDLTAIRFNATDTGLVLFIGELNYHTTYLQKLNVCCSLNWH